LRFANPSPPSSWMRDFHPQVVKHAWQTRKAATSRRTPKALTERGDVGVPISLVGQQR
jgi:hypothetical protein